MIASPNITWNPEPAIYLLSGQPEGNIAKSIFTFLQSLKLEVKTMGIIEKPRGAVIFILDLKGQSFLQDIATDKYAQVKDLLSKLTPTGMLWLMRLS